VQAPFAGVAGAHLADVGALVGATSPTKLATLVQLDPIHVSFSVNERDVLRVRAELAARGIRRPDQPRADGPPLEIALANESAFLHRGYLDYVAPQLDATTGTPEVRGVFANPDRALLPGLFVRVRVPVSTRQDALMVSETALGADQLGRYLLLVKPDGTVEQRPVQAGQQVGPLRVILQGIAATDRVVIGNLQRAIPGAKVEVEQGSLAAPAR
jgi:RND family efflux transporter MFP subunit